MTKSNTQVIAKVAAIVAGAGLVLSSFAYALPAGAQTTTTTTTTTSSAMFTRDLTIGSTGADVTALQTWLISKGFSIPAGATGYFGTQTQAAVAAYQAANGITPAAGYFGPITRAKVNAGGSVVVPGDDDDDDDNSSDDDDSDLGDGEASLEDLNGNGGDDDGVEEGGTAEVAEFEFDVEDGDVRISRLDLGFYFDGTAASTEEDEPWETFETITIYDADGDELASEDVTDEDDWLDEDEPYMFRFTNLDYIVRDGDMGTLVVEVEAQNSIDGADETISWTVFVGEDGIRGTDGEGIEQYLGEDSGNLETADDEGDLEEGVSFDIETEGEGEELNVSSSDEDPDSTVLQLEDDGRSDWYNIFAFDVEAEEADVELDEIQVQLIAATSTVNQQINDLELVVDGETYDDWAYGAGTTGATTTANVIFDIDGDSTIDADSTVTVELHARFNALDGTPSEGATIQARVLDNGVRGEGADDIDSDGSATGEVHTLSLSEIEVTDVDSSSSENPDGDVGTISFEFTVEANDGPVTIDSASATSGTDGNVNYTILGPSQAIDSATLTRIGGNSADTTEPYVVAEGERAIFSLDVTFTTTVGGANDGTYRVRLDSVAGVEIDKTSDPVSIAY